MTTSRLELTTTKLELPDGRLVTIQGGPEVKELAQFIINTYLRPLGSVSQVQNSSEEEALDVPVMNFVNATVQTQPLRSAPVFNEPTAATAEEEALPLPCFLD